MISENQWLKPLFMYIVIYHISAGMRC